MISVNDLTLERYFEPVFKPVSFSLEAGELMLITGDNGCGKTTLIRILAGVLAPSQGRIDWADGGRVYVGHMLAVKDDLTVTENIDFMRQFIGHGAHSTAEIVERVGLRRVSEQAARTLSAGQRKRCALARLLLSDAPLWLLDEPYSNLDKQGMIMLDGILHRHLDGGGACALATHGSLRPQGFEVRECELVSGASRR
jgi:heme exporter protein A